MCARARQYLCPSTAIISPTTRRKDCPRTDDATYEEGGAAIKVSFSPSLPSFLLLFSGEPKQSEGNLDKGIAKCPSFHQKRMERSGEWGGREHVFHPISPYLCKLLLIAGPRRRGPLASHHANRAVQNYGNGTKFDQFLIGGIFAQKCKCVKLKNHMNVKTTRSETSVPRLWRDLAHSSTFVRQAGPSKRASGPSPFSDREPCLSMGFSSEWGFSGSACVRGGLRVGVSGSFQEDVEH